MDYNIDDMTKNYSYPNYDDSDIQSKIFKKREFYYNLVPQRGILKSYDEIQKYRSAHCKIGNKDPTEQQLILPNFINTNTPYKGILIMHGVGSGKTMTAIRIAEQFKDQIKKYNTKIYVLVPGPTTKENFKNELRNSTGETYIKNKELLSQLSKKELDHEKKVALSNALQYYKILSYKTFYKKVLGEKILEKRLVKDNKIKSVIKKNKAGEIEREIVVDRIVNLNNSVLIVDEAHNVTGNEWGQAIKKIIKNSENLRLILLTATPMINLADQVVDLLNFLRPLDDQIERNKIFTKEKNYNMTIKTDGINYLKKKANGYISFYRGSIPYTFAKRIDEGEIPEGLLFTPIIKCFMTNFQYETYMRASKKFIKIMENEKNDSLYMSASAASNFVFPILTKDRENIIGHYSTEGLITLLSQVNSDGTKLKRLINEKLFDNQLSKEEEDNFIIDNGKKNISGNIFKIQYVKNFSIKFYTIITNLAKLVEGNKGSHTAFIFSNLVKAGIELLAEALIQNGYLEYQESFNDYDIKDNTIDYNTGLTFLEFKKNKLTNFRPATFLLVVGSSEESYEDISEYKQKIIQEVFNNVDNIDGKYIKFILGSRVMNEGVTLKNCKEVHMLDSFFNIPKMEQVIGRVIRICVHQDVITDNYREPEVHVFKYVVGLDNRLSTDEILYQKAELKYLTVKKIERAMKEVAVDCPLLLHANMFPEEIDKYKNCVPPTLENIKSKNVICPALCDFQPCDIKCDSKELNNKYWDEENKTYKYLSKKDIDYNTYDTQFVTYEIDLIKNKIKDLYRFKHVYVYDEIVNEIKNSCLKHQCEMFDEYPINKAIEDIMPKTENDFNNFQDTIYDKYNRPGYIIQRDKYYIFQPFNEYEDVPYYYRKKINIHQENQISLDNYIKQEHDINKSLDIFTNIEESGYNFDDVLDYYNEKEENFIVGIIDKNLNKLSSDDIDLFKIRPAQTKEDTKKRGIGIYSFKGAVCFTAKNKEYLMKLLKKIPNITQNELTKMAKLTKNDLCNILQEKLLYLEKYSTSKDKNKLTYIIIPKDHPIYPFPYNLEDRIKYIIKYFSNIAKINMTNSFIVKKQKDSNNNTVYELSINANESKYIVKELEKENFILSNKIWTKIIN